MAYRFAFSYNRCCASGDFKTIGIGILSFNATIHGVTLWAGVVGLKTTTTTTVVNEKKKYPSPSKQHIIVQNNCHLC
jgi:hypothetical protein